MFEVVLVDWIIEIITEMRFVLLNIAKTIEFLLLLLLSFIKSFFNFSLHNFFLFLPNLTKRKQWMFTLYILWIGIYLYWARISTRIFKLFFCQIQKMGKFINFIINRLKSYKLQILYKFCVLFCVIVLKMEN